MPAGKFSAIIRKVSEHVALEPHARLTFEVSDGIRPMMLHRAGPPVVTGAEVHVDLSPRPASCKPRDRWLAAEKQRACCDGQPAQACCASA